MKIQAYGFKSSVDKQTFDAAHPMFRYEVPEVPVSVSQFLNRAKKIVVVGMGGSVLPLQAFVAGAHLESQILFADNLERRSLEPLLKDPDCVFCVVSKSGETLEVKAVLAEIILADRLSDCLFVTDPVKGSLREMATAKGILTLEIPPELGGRFTNFSVFHRAVLERFQINFDGCVRAAQKECERLKQDPSSLSWMFHSIFGRPSASVILWTYSADWKALLAWMQQAIAESLGKMTKDGKRYGSSPVVLEGPKDQHSVLQLLTEGPQDKALWFFIPSRRKLDGTRVLPDSLGLLQSQSLETIQDLLAEATFKTFEERTLRAETLQPLLRFDLAFGVEEISRVVAITQAFIEYAGKRLAINAFDQPGVERGKQIARELLSH